MKYVDEKLERSNNSLDRSNEFTRNVSEVATKCEAGCVACWLGNSSASIIIIHLTGDSLEP